MASIPKQLFVTRYPTNSTEPPLGFLHGYAPHTDAGKKRMNTQLEWAYGRVEVDEQSGLWVKTGSDWVRNHNIPSNQAGAYDRVEWVKPIPSCYYPMIWDNDPLEGFKVLTSVSRYSTSNKLWRVQDPRGVVLEITTGCFEKIIMATTITKGLIEGKCRWISNKNLEFVG